LLSYRHLAAAAAATKHRLRALSDPASGQVYKKMVMRSMTLMINDQSKQRMQEQVAVAGDCERI